MPFYVYVLHSKAYNKIYIGYTADLSARILSHNQLAKKGYTTKFRPWRLCFTESFESKDSALKREKELKSARGRKFIRNLIEKDYIERGSSW
jgi:putative endonuclease